MAGARWTALVVVTALALGAGGCGDSSTAVEQVAFVAPVQDNGLEWTQQARAVVERLPGVRVDAVDGSQTDDLAGAFEQAADGSQLVIAHDSRYADAAARAAAETDVPTLVWGERDDDGDAPVAGITVQDKEGGYMAGIIAAKASILRRLSIVVVDDGTAWDLATWNRTVGGFVAGARSIDPDVKLTVVRVARADATPDELHRIALRLLRDEWQMVFALGRDSTLGALRAVGEVSGESHFVGVVGDKAKFDRANCILTSVMWDTRAVFRQAVRDVRAGRFGERPYRLTIRNRGIWVHSTGRTPSDAYEAALQAGDEISRGTIDVPVTSTDAAVEQLLAGGAATG